MRVFCDTNVLVAAYAARGVCREVMYRCIEKHHLFISAYLLSELKDKLRIKIKLTPEECKAIIDYLQRNGIMVEDVKTPERVSRDPDDDPILSAAHVARVDCLLSGDKDLLVLKTYKGIPIISPGQFWKLEATRD